MIGQRNDFPVLQNTSTIYLDSAASAQKPQPVLDAMDDFHRRYYSNVHRGVYRLSGEATDRYEQARSTIARFVGAAREEEIIFTRGATEAINLVAWSWGRTFLKPNDEILVTLLEHHSNFVPWQIIAEQTGAVVRYVGLTPEGDLDTADFHSKLSERTKIVAITQLSNALGVAPDLPTLLQAARQAGAVTVVDGAQGAAHFPVDVRALGADFYAFSAHKLYGPTGFGVLYGRYDLLSKMPPVIGGGHMISSVTVEGTQFAEPPARFEAGTPHIAGAIGLAAAIEYLERLGLEAIERHEQSLLDELHERLAALPEVRVLGPKGRQKGLLTFTIDGIHPHDLAQSLAAADIAVRAGHHCAQPLLKALGVSASTRVSFGLYNNSSDLDALIEALKGTMRFFLKTHRG